MNVLTGCYPLRVRDLGKVNASSLEMTPWKSPQHHVTCLRFHIQEPTRESGNREHRLEVIARSIRHDLG